MPQGVTLKFGNMSIMRFCRDYYWRSRFWELPFRSHSVVTISQLIDPVRAWKQPEIPPLNPNHHTSVIKYTDFTRQGSCSERNISHYHKRCNDLAYDQSSIILLIIRGIFLYFQLQSSVLDIKTLYYVKNSHTCNLR